MQTERSLNQRDHVALSSFVFATARPTELRFGDLVVPAEGIDGPRTWSGVYGPGSTQDASQVCYVSASARRLSLHLVRSWYPLRQLGAHARESITCLMAQTTGFLDIRRAQREFALELRATVLQHLAKVLGAAAFEPLVRMRLVEIVLRHPAASVQAILDSEPLIEMVVHNVWMASSASTPQHRKQIRVGSIRRASFANMTSDVVHGTRHVAVTDVPG